MKLKYADHSHWSNKPSNVYRQRFIDTVDFKGYISILKFDDISNPISFNVGSKHEFIIIDNAYSWVQHFPLGGNHILTTVLNNKDKLVQHYFDVILSSSVTSEGIPFFEDLFLDVILLPNNEIHILDEEELLKAFNKHEISRDEYDLAINEMSCIKKTLELDENKLIKRWEKDYQTLQVLL